MKRAVRCAFKNRVRTPTRRCAVEFTLIELLACPPKPLGRRRSRSAFTLIELLACPPKHLGRRRSRSAFTLIELLVVIAIIGLLISLLAPTLGGVRERAREVGCLSKQRQMGVAMLLFARDNHEHLPQVHGRDSSPWNFPDFSWANQIWPYLSGGGWPQFARFFHCPSDPVPYHYSPNSSSDFQDTNDGTVGWFSYGYNMSAGCAYFYRYGMGAWPAGSPHFRRKRISELPANGILLSETRSPRWMMLSLNIGYGTLIGAVKFVHGGSGLSVLIPDTPGDPISAPVGWSTPYGGGDRANLLHVDGSTRTYRIDEVHELPRSRWRFD